MEDKIMTARRPRKGTERKQSRKFEGFFQAHNESVIPLRRGRTAKFCRKSPEGKMVEFGMTHIINGKLQRIWSFLLPHHFEENYNSWLFNQEGISPPYNLPKKFMGKRVVVPEPLPLPKEWRALLPKVVTIKTFGFDFEDEWVHTHFTSLYDLNKEYGAVYIEPSNDCKKVFFIGRGNYACHYFLELDK